MKAIVEHDLTVYQGDVREQLAALEAGAVQCVVTSPPYYGLRDYGVDGQIGLEASPAEYVAELVGVFREVRRVLADDGVCWLNLGDSYSGGKRGSYDDKGGNPLIPPRVSASRPVTDIPGKNLLGIPWRVAFALQDDGWTLRNAAVWHKPNAMPESVTDRLSTRYEHVFLLSKSRRYWFDLDAIREPSVTPERHVSALSWDRETKEADVPGQSMRQHRRGRTPYSTASAVGGQPQRDPDANGLGLGVGGRNPGDFWEYDETPFEMPTGALTAEEAAYIASFIDGEGSICIRRRKTQIQMMLTVVNTHEGVIRWLHERTGMGQIKQREVRNEKWRPVWEWSVTSRQAAQVIHAVLPYFRVKREQALVALHFMDTTRRAGGGVASPEYHARRHDMAEDMAALNAGRITHSRFAAPPAKPQPSSAGDVWTVATSPFPGAHFATMPPELARRCILAGCPNDGTVLDPFAGSGTTLMVARKLGRKAVGVELNPDYIDIIRQRIGQTPLDFGASA